MTNLEHNLQPANTEKIFEAEGPTRNLNDEVLVKVTPEGETAYQEYYRAVFKGSSVDIPTLERDADGYSRMQLWEVANIFGPHMYMGAALPIETELKFVEEKE